MAITTRFRYLLILVAFLGFVAFLRPHQYLPQQAKDYLPASFRPSETDYPDISLDPVPVSEQPGVSEIDAPEQEIPTFSGAVEDSNSESVSEPVSESVSDFVSLEEPGLDQVSWQDLWSDVYSCFKAHDPIHFDELLWPSVWPTMPGYQMNKTFDRDEVVLASPSLSQANMDNAVKMHESLKASIPKWSKYSSLYRGKGYVMTTGNDFLNRVFPIGLQMLHKLGSELPVEIWTKNQEEYALTMPIVQDLSKRYHMSITCHRFSDFVDISQFPADYTSNYLMKAMTMLLSSFEEVIMLDADNVPMLSPEEILSSEEYASTGLVLWPDFWSNSLSATLHTILNIPYSFHRTCESGQVILDKKIHFESLIYANYFNWYGDKYYKLITLDGMGSGDKDTFVVGAQTAGKSFHFTTRPVELLRAVYLNGTQWKQDTSVFNGAMGQFNPLNQSQVMFMHMHSPKVNLQNQEDVTADLVFVRADSPDVHFYPASATLEQMLWESIVWIECESVLRVDDDPRNVCGRAKARLTTLQQ